MNPLLGLSEYLGKLEKNLRLFALSRGVAAVGGAALVFTVLLVVGVNSLSFSDPSVFWARVLLFLVLAAAISAALVIPLVRLNRRFAARKAERRFPQFGQRLLTFTERSEKNANDPFLPLLAMDTLEIARQADSQEVVHKGRIASLASIGAAAVLALIWLGVSGPGFLGYGTSLLWGGLPKADRQPFYSVRVEPGNKIIRRRSDQMVTAKLSGFLSPKVNLRARYGSSTKWEQAAMMPQPSGSGYEFLLAGVPENVEYYVEAGGVRSNTYKLSVMDLPAVKNVRVTYHYPSWLGLKDEVEDPGGDLRAVEGTTAEVEIQTDRPLSNGALTLDDGSKIELEPGTGNKRIARVPIKKDGMYHVATTEQGEPVRLSEDYFIEARKDSPPMVTLLRPARDAKVSPIEEVSVAVKGSDDFGLHGLDLHYSVNGGPEKAISVLKSKGAKTGEGATTLYLEDYKLVPGDVVSLYATARDARNTAKTDIYFIEAQPFEKEYSQSQQQGGGGDGEGDDQKGISARQKEIIAATWNELKGSPKDKATAAENAKYLSEVQSKLRDQAQSLADRMKKRELASSNPAFQAFVKDMEEAVAQMGPASDKLKGLKWQDAMQPEQKALQYLLRAESTFRQIQVAFGKQSGGAGKGGAGRDLENLFDLELDTEKNQYESGQQSAAEKKQKEIDDALKKLEELARRQQQLADQNKNQQQTSQQRWQQEMLRRDAEQLRREMEQMTRDNSSQQQQGQSQQQSQQGQGGQSGQTGQQSAQQQKQQQQQPQGGQPGQMGQQQKTAQQKQLQQRQMDRMSPEQRQTMQEALNRLSQATREMSGAASAQGSPQQGAQGKAQADAERAAERLKEAREMLAGMRKQQAGDEIDDIANRAAQLAKQQEGFEQRMRKTFGDEASAMQAGPQTAERMAQEKQQMINDLQGLEQEMQRAARDLANTQRAASTKLREGLGNMQQQELQTRMKWTQEALRRGLGSYAVMREAPVTQGLNQLKDQVRQAQGALDRGQQPGQRGTDKLEQALSQAENLRRQIEQMRNGQGKLGQGQQKGQQPGQQGQPGQQPGQQGQPGQQPGQQQGQSADPNSSQPDGQSAGQGMGTFNSSARGGQQPSGGPVGPSRDPEGNYRDTLRDLGRLQQAVQGNPEVAREVQDLSRQMQRLNPNKYSSNPELLEQIHSRILAQIEQVELLLRRKIDEQGGTVRSGAQQPPPPGYADAVAEYFRRLSKEH